MADPSELSISELELIRHSTAATYLSAHLRLMMRALGVDAPDTDSINAMILVLIDPMNFATKAMWYALMGDDKLEEALQEFRDSLKELRPNG
jgi:hypothetical protein